MKTRYLIPAIIMTASTILSGQGVSVGDKAPVIKASTDDGSTWDMNNFLGKNYIVVYFYPGAMTGGCTKQACAYRDSKDDLQSAGAVVVGISSDNTENLKLFRRAENLNFPLISDVKGELAKKYGVPLGAGGAIKRTVDGKEYDLVRDISEKRWTFIIGKDGKIVYKNESVDPEKDSAEVLAFLKNQAASSGL
jgi:thioredoxin-dependent peroxiredoxin